MNRNFIRKLGGGIGQRSEKGQDLAEYSVMIGLIALLVAVSLAIIGTSLSNVFIAISTAISNGL